VYYYSIELNWCTREDSIMDLMKLNTRKRSINCTTSCWWTKVWNTLYQFIMLQLFI